MWLNLDGFDYQAKFTPETTGSNLITAEYSKIYLAVFHRMAKNGDREG